MTYKQLHKIEKAFFIVFAIFIFLYNFQLIFKTRNMANILANSSESSFLSLYNKKTEVKTKKDPDLVNKQSLMSINSWPLPLQDDYNKDKQTISVSKPWRQLLVLFNKGKGLINQLKIQLNFYLFLSK